jgi:hypothetical protein
VIRACGVRGLGAAGLAVVVLALVVAGCGGSASPSVASLGGSDTTPGASGAPAGDDGPGSGIGGSLIMKTQNGLEFAKCMRAHGVPNFPDPNGQGVIQIAGSAIDPRSAKFQAAQRACQKVLPNGGRPSPQQLAKMRLQALAFSACMRNHGLPDFPDPSFSGGGVRLSLRAGPGSDVNPSSPTFQAAQRACQGHLPGNLGGGSTGGK